MKCVNHTWVVNVRAIFLSLWQLFETREISAKDKSGVWTLRKPNEGGLKTSLEGLTHSSNKLGAEFLLLESDKSDISREQEGKHQEDNWDEHFILHVLSAPRGNYCFGSMCVRSQDVQFLLQIVFVLIQKEHLSAKWGHFLRRFPFFRNYFHQPHLQGWHKSQAI